jgi:hypothetical protein
MDAVVAGGQTASVPLPTRVLFSDFRKGVPVMKNLPNEFPNFKVCFRILILVTAVCALAALTPRATATTSFTISVVNNGGSEIRHVYLSPADNDNWGSDQLNTSISAGATRNLQVSWDQSTVKVVAEDQEGCFLTTTVSASGTQVWTLTNDTARDCGSGQ